MKNCKVTKRTRQPSVDEKRLFPGFRTLAGKLSRAGCTIPAEDHEGMSGVLFRFYWHIRESVDSPPRWSAASAIVCSGDPLERAAEASGFTLVRGDGPAGGAGGKWIPVEKPESAYGLLDRIQFMERSIDLGIRYTHEDEYLNRGVFASGHAAYDQLLADLGDDPDRFLPQSPEEARRFLPADTPVEEVPDDILPAYSMIASLRGTLNEIGSARMRLNSYLDRVGNFIDSASASGMFRREAKALYRAADRLPDLQSIVEKIRAPQLDRETRREIEHRVREARDAYIDGLRALKSRTKTNTRATRCRL